MNKQIPFIVLAVLIVCGGALVLMWQSQTQSSSRNYPSSEATTPSTVKGNEKGSVGISTNITLDPEERAIENVPHLTRSEKDFQLKWYRVHRDYAETELSIHVVDSTGKNVQDASVLSCFLPKSAKGTTDSNGLYTSTGKLWGEFVCFVKKEGCYDTKIIKWLGPSHGDNVIDGKWVPYHRTIEVTLKEKRNPIPMYVKNATIKFPKKGEPFGYDFEKGDWVAPHGKGEQADFFFTCSIEARGAYLDFRKELLITAAQQGGGMIVNAKDTESWFTSRYEAQETGYEPQYHLLTDSTEFKVLQNVELDKADYLTFRSRVVVDGNGNAVSAHYGKILALSYGRSDTTAEIAQVTLFYYFNPTPNDRNIEFDTDKNLFKNERLGRVPVP